MSRRERHNPVANRHQILRLARKNDGVIFIISVIKRADSDRITCCDKGTFFRIVNHAGKLRIEHGKHVRSVFTVERQ